MALCAGLLRHHPAPVEFGSATSALGERLFLSRNQNLRVELESLSDTWLP